MADTLGTGLGDNPTVVQPSYPDTTPFARYFLGYTPPVRSLDLLRAQAPESLAFTQPLGTGFSTLAPARNSLNILQDFFHSLGSLNPFGGGGSSSKGVYATKDSPSGPSGGGGGLTSGDIQQGSGGVNQWAGQINDAAKQTGTPAAVIAAIMEGESGGNASAYSPQGATGLMQVMPQYWSDLAKQFGGNLSDPKTNILVGATILKQNHDRAVKAYGSDDAKAWNIAAAAYLGDWNWNSGSYAGNSDAYGTNGSEYVNRFHQNLQKFGGLTASLTQDNRSQSVIGSSNAAIQTAQKFVGQPYVWGGASPSSGFDCSGLVQWSYAQSGYKLPRTAQEQYDATQRVSADQLKPGDLVFFTGTYNAGVPVTHVGIYVGNGKMLDSQNDGIVYDDLSSPYWQSHLYGYGRVT